MRVTNKMIMENAANNINSTKELVNKRNTQMTTQKKISKPSDDPVVAVRSLRLSTTLSVVDQYYSKNIPDAASWLDVSETALTNIRDIVRDCRNLSVAGSTDTYSEQDRKTYMNQLEELQKQLYAEGNADYAGRTVFTGYRTNENLTFTEDEVNTRYRIDQTLSVEDSMEAFRYYSGNVDVPTTQAEVLNNAISDTAVTEYYRVRFAYDGIDSINSFEINYKEDVAGVETDITYLVQGTATDDVFTNTNKDTQAAAVNPTGVAFQYTIYDDLKSWEEHKNGKTIEDNEIIVIRETGEMIFGKELATKFKESDATIKVNYDKTGFDTGELRPEYYFNCSKRNDPNDTKCPVDYVKFAADGSTKDFDIEYMVAQGQTLAVNVEAYNVFDSSLQRDLGEMLNAVEKTLAAHEKIDTINKMMGDTQYASSEYQEKLSEWLDAAQKEADYADDNMQKLFSSEIGKIDSYYAKINLAITDLGCKVDSLNLTKTRVGDQQESVKELQSKNDDMDLSEIIISYTAAYTAYQASLTAASKLGSNTLLNYI